MTKILLLSSLILLTACSSGYGHQAKGENLSVYFMDKTDEGKAEKVAFYWKENGLITGKKQDLQIVKLSESHQLNIIKSFEGGQSIPFEERKLLLNLQTKLEEEIFSDGLEIIICNDKFESIHKIN
ncbi:MAG: hypothetical protein ACKVJC_02210 [Flavobacteriales bacterium]